MRRFMSLTLAISLLVGLLAFPASASRWNREKPDNVVAALAERSGGTDNLDKNRRDFDILIAAVIGAGLVDTLSDTGDITVWAPNDRAFARLARDLGYDGSYDEGAIAGFVVGAAGELLVDILTYHVTPGEFTVFKVLRTKTFPTLQGEVITRRFLTLQDGEPDLRNPRITWPLNIRTGNDSVIHAIDRVLIPIDL